MKKTKMDTKLFMLEVCTGQIFKARARPGPAEVKVKILARARQDPKEKLKFRPELGPANIFPIMARTA